MVGRLVVHPVVGLDERTCFEKYKLDKSRRDLLQRLSAENADEIDSFFRKKQISWLNTDTALGVAIIGSAREVSHMGIPTGTTIARL